MADATPKVNGPAAKLICQALGFDNVTKIAEATGWNRSVLSSVFSGARTAGLDLAIALSHLTGQPVHVFLGPSDPKAAFLAAARAQGLELVDTDGMAS